MTFTAWLLALALVQTPAGTIRGRVTDATGLPLAGVTVTIKGSETFAVTAESGDFSLALTTSRATLVVELPGFSSRELTGSAGQSLEIVLTVAKVADAVIVKAAPPVSQPDTRVTVMPLDVVRIAGTQADLMRALATMAGVATIDEGAGLYVRGGDVSEVAVLVDGVTVNHPYRYETPTGGFRGAVDAFLTQGASFSTGGFGAANGNALSGILELTGLGRPRARQMTATAGLAGLSLSVAQLTGSNSGIRIAANRTTPSVLFKANPSPREFDDLPGGWDLSGSAHLDSARAGNFKFFALTQSDHVGVKLEHDAFIGFLHSKTAHHLAIAKWERSLPGWRLTASAGSDNYAKTTDVGVLAVDVVDDVQSARADMLGAARQWTIRFGMDASIARTSVNGTTPSKGGDFSGVDGISPFRLSRRDWHVGAYSEAARTFRALAITVGARTDHFDRNRELTADGRAAATVALSKSQHLRFAWGIYHQAPAAGYFDEVEGVSTLHAMRATHLIAGYELGAPVGRSFLRVEAYSKKYTNLPLEDPILHYVATGYGTARGLDIFAKRTWAHVSSRTSASWVSAARRWTPWDQQDRYPLPQGTWPPDFSIPYTFEEAATISIYRGVGFNASWRTAAGRPFTPVAGATPRASGYEPVWGSINSDRLPRYERFDLGTSMPLPLSHKTTGLLYVSFDNVLNRQNVFEYSYSADYAERHPVVTASPRSWYIGVTVIK